MIWFFCILFWRKIAIKRLKIIFVLKAKKCIWYHAFDFIDLFTSNTIFIFFCSMENKICNSFVISNRWICYRLKDFLLWVNISDQFLSFTTFYYCKFEICGKGDKIELRNTNAEVFLPLRPNSCWQCLLVCMQNHILKLIPDSMAFQH